MSPNGRTLQPLVQEFFTDTKIISLRITFIVTWTLTSRISIRESHILHERSRADRGGELAAIQALEYAVTGRKDGALSRNGAKSLSAADGAPVSESARKFVKRKPRQHNYLAGAKKIEKY